MSNLPTAGYYPGQSPPQPWPQQQQTHAAQGAAQGHPASLENRMQAFMRDIGGRISALEARLEAIARAAGGGSSPPRAGSSGAADAAAPVVASAQDLDSQYGDEEIRLNVKDWNGPPMRGRTMSQCPPEFLDMYASLLDWVANQQEMKREMANNGKPRAGYSRRTAGRARGWAQRMRAPGWVPREARPNLETYDPWETGQSPQDILGEDQLPL